MYGSSKASYDKSQLIQETSAGEVPAPLAPKTTELSREELLMDVRNQHRHLAKLQAGWHTDAMRDYHYNQNRCHIERAKGNYVLARGYCQEAQWDLFWGKRRAGIVRRERRLGKR